ncbi:MAG TPA: hypothetical protein VG323_21075 [Thermoanaerobaculia bacterium]|nr:hypothetical protein [Thermoanaerobaculia bacterium]
MTLFLGLLFSTALAAAPVNLGPEIPVGDPVFGNAALNQTVASVASNGRDYLVLWNDAREFNPTTPAPALWVGRVDADGHPLQPTGHKLVDGAVGKLLWTGTSYVAVYSVSGISFEQFLDDDGNPTSPPIHLSLGGPSLAVGTNGNNILTTDPTGEIFLVDFNGGVERQHIGRQIGAVSQIAADPGGNYFFAAIETDCGAPTCAQHMVVESVDSGTAVVTHHPLTDVNLGTQMNGTASDDGQRMLIAWNDRVADALSIRYEIVDSTGHVLAGPALLVNNTSFYAISVGWDGHDFFVAAAEQGWRISSNGQILDHGPADTEPLFAYSAGGVLEARNVATAIDADVLIRAAPSFAQLNAAPERSVAMSSRWQQRPRLAASEAGFTAWLEPPTSLFVQPAGGTITQIADVSPWSWYFPPTVGVARGGNGYLIAWEAKAGDKLGFLARRLALDGTPVDANPISFAFNEDFQFDGSRTISIAFDGTNFLAVWAAHNGAVHGVRISLSGKVLDDTPLVLAQPNNHDAVTPRVVWNGKNFVIAWLDEIVCHCLISPPPAPQSRAYAIRAGSDGQPLDSQPIPLWDKLTATSSLALATNGQDAAVVWTDGNCVYAAGLRADGTPAGDPRTLTCRAPQPVYGQTFDNVGIAWSGSEYVAIWRDFKADVIHAARLDAALAPIDDDFDVSPSGFGASQPDIAPTAAGVAIAYVRYAPEAQFGGPPRIFVRSLARLGPAQRKRATR